MPRIEPFIAFHEAGHALIASLQGQRFVPVSMEPNKDLGSLANVTAELPMAAMVRCTLAGPMAGRKILDYPRDHDAKDRLDAFRGVARIYAFRAGLTFPEGDDDAMMSFIEDNHTGIGPIYQQLQQETELLVEVYWKAIRRLATLLMVKGGR